MFRSIGVVILLCLSGALCWAQQSTAPGRGELAVAQPPESGPFGLTAGMTREQVEKIVGATAVVSQKGNEVTYSTVPEPYPLFKTYTLTFSHKYGLAQVMATSFDPAGVGNLDNSSGSFTRSKCKEVLSTLSGKYGQPSQSSGCELKAKAECSEPNEASTWSPSPRSDEVSSVFLFADLASMTKDERGEWVTAGCGEDNAQLMGTIQVAYMFDNWSKYQQEVKSTL